MNPYLHFTHTRLVSLVFESSTNTGATSKQSAMAAFTHRLKFIVFP